MKKKLLYTRNGVMIQFGKYFPEVSDHPENLKRLFQKRGITSLDQRSSLKIKILFIGTIYLTETLLF